MILVVLAAAVAAVLWVMAGRIESGKTQPNMGHHTPENTTAASWAKMLVATGEAMRWGVRLHIFAIVIGVAWAALVGSATRGASVVAVGMSVAAVILVLGVIRAFNLLVSTEPSPY